ncbi:MAG: PKD domain-containing protein, partial [Candidatus Thermoplasmatota archaeon]|nr:PKD domain-containing protein [Candidatus Thermoplasmatota archaeon]
MRRKILLLPLITILALSFLVPSVQIVKGDQMYVFGGSSAPTRAYFQETESNNNWATANRIPITSGNRMELHGNLSSGNDLDFYYFTMNGGAGPVDRIEIAPTYINATSQSDYFVGWFWGFYPNNAMSTADNNALSLAIEMWIPQWTWPVHIDASYTGNYGLLIRAADPSTFSGKMEYNFTVSMSPVTPRDPTNDEGSAQEVPKGSTSISGGLYTDEDLFDWYHVTAPHDIHPTVLDLTFSLTNPSHDSNDGIYDWGVEVDLFVKWDSRSSPGTFQPMQRYRIALSSRTLFLSNGCSPSPFSLKLEKNCTEMYFGFMIQSFGIDSRGNRMYNTLSGSVSTSLNVNLYANIPNQRPQLLNASVDRPVGVSSDIFTFSVIYREIQNESAQFVELWKNGEPFKLLSPDAQSGENYISGVVYETTVTGSQIGPDGDYRFNISATDGKDWAVDPPSGVRTFNVRIDNNLPPQSNFGDKYVFKTIEDSDPAWIPLDTVFTDPDIDTELTYTLLHPDGTFKGYIYTIDEEDFKASLVNNGTLLAPEWRLVVEPEENVNGQIHVVVNATDNAVFPRSVEVNFTIDIKPVNDPPVIKRVGSIDTTKFKTAEFYNLEQGELEELTIIAEDIDNGDVLKFSWDIGEKLYSSRRGTNFDWNQSTGDLWFTTTDGDVPGFETTITVSDGKGGTDSVVVNFEIDNINDPPTIKVPSYRSTIEGEYLYINPTYSDPDLDSGDIITFTYTMGALESVTPSNAIEFSQTTGRLVLKAVSDKMNGEWEINITVVDLYGLSDWGICRITIENVNDPPVAYPINLEQLDENLTVIFHTLEAEDEDGEDTLTYIWEFGDGSDPEEGVNLRDISHTFPGSGAYTVTLTVFDGESYSEIRETIVTVTSPPEDPDPDRDGMSTDWELRFGLDPYDPTDAEMDYDSDGLTNLQEYEYSMRKGVYLNPWNPDSDGDGFKDGEEVEKNYDPMDASLHPEESYETLSLLLWLGVIVAILLMVMAGIVFMILKLRNRPKAFATPAFPAMQTYPELGEAYYEQFPPATTGYLPPYQDQGPFQDTTWPAEQDEGYWQQTDQQLPSEPQMEQPDGPAPEEAFPYFGDDISEPPVE